jgi:hypothetical protein
MNYETFINNREISTIVWIFILMLWFMTYKNVRNSMLNILKDLFTKQILIINLGIVLYVSLMIIFFDRIGFWDITAIKDTIIWLIASTLVIIVHSITSKDILNKIKESVIDCIKLVVLLEFITNLYSFSLFTELILVPIISLLYILYFISRKDKKLKIGSTIIGIILGIFTLIILGYTVISITSNINQFLTFKNLRDYLLPIVFTLAFVPYVYIWGLISLYENFFIRLGIFNTNKTVLRYAKIFTIIECNININKISRLSQLKGSLLLNEKEDINTMIRNN